MLVLDYASSKNVAHATIAQPMSSLRSIAEKFALSARWQSRGHLLATMLRRTLVDLACAVIVDPINRHMERKAALHALTGFTTLALDIPDDNDPGQSGVARSPKIHCSMIDDAPVEALPPRRSAYRARRRTAQDVTVITTRAAAGMRRVRSIEPFASSIGLFEIEESQPCT